MLLRYLCVRPSAKTVTTCKNRLSGYVGKLGSLRNHDGSANGIIA